MTTMSFTTLNDQADPTFNQLLGINDAGVIAGYFGSGTPAAVHPNKGYTLTPFYGQASYHNENFPGSQQTQVTGLNNRGVTAGFWADANGDNFGFVEHNGHFVNVVDPQAPKPVAGTPSVQQLLGVNDRDQAVGFYVDAQGNSHGFVYDIHANRFEAVNVAGFSNVTATGLNDKGEISGFVVNAQGQDEGFVRDEHGRVTLLAGPQGAVSTQALGLNNTGEVVGVYTDSAQKMHGFVYDAKDHHYLTVDDPNGVGTTTVNGINDRNQLVGFYVDAAGNTDGMLVNVSGLHRS